MKRSITVYLFSCLMAGAAGAQTWEVSAGASYTRFGGTKLGSASPNTKEDDDTKLKGKPGYGVRVTLNTPGYYGHEFSYFIGKAGLTARIRPDANNDANVIVRSDSVRTQEAAYNFLIYMMPKGERWRPFITGGAQMQDYAEPNIPEWSHGKSRNYGANYGAGIKIKLMEHALFRADFRHYFSGRPYDLPFKDETKLSGGILGQMRGSVGLSIGF